MRGPLASSAFLISSDPGAAKIATPAVAEEQCVHLCVYTCVSLGGLGRSLKAIQEWFLLGEILFFLLGFSKTLILPAKCKIICCCDGTKRQMITGVSNSCF